MLKSLLLITLFLVGQVEAQAEAKEGFLTKREKKLLELAKRPDYIGKQARNELAKKPAAFYKSLVKAEQVVVREQLEKSLENAWEVRDDFEMQELFFKVLERELAPPAGPSN